MSNNIEEMRDELRRRVEHKRQMEEINRLKDELFNRNAMEEGVVYMTTEEVAEAAEISVSTVLYHIRQGNLPRSMKFRCRWVIHPDDCKQLINIRTVAA